MEPLHKWDVLSIHCGYLYPPHNKFCICICPKRGWFFFVNTQPPTSRKAREYVIALHVSQAQFLSHDSHIDTTVIQQFGLSDIQAALTEEKRKLGSISPTLRVKIMETVKAHGALSPEELEAVISED